MFILKRYKIRSYEMGLYFRDGEFRRLLDRGTHWFLDPLGKVRVDVVSKREPWLVHEKLDLIVKSGALGTATARSFKRTRLDDQVQLLMHQPRFPLGDYVHADLAQRVREPVYPHRATVGTHRRRKYRPIS